MRAAGNPMHGAGIDDGDVLLVDRAVTAAHGAVVIAVVEGDPSTANPQGFPFRPASEKYQNCAGGYRTADVDRLSSRLIVSDASSMQRP
jgi:hypothetical protein